jgi:GNAT superfamily N-acetyltransferase
MQIKAINLAQAAAAEELMAVARCHCAAFPHALASALGEKFVSNMLSWYPTTGKGFIIYMESEPGTVVAYCSGLYKDGSLRTGATSGMAQHSWGAAIWAILQRPGVIFHPEWREKWGIIWQNLRLRFNLSSSVLTPATFKKAMAASPYLALASIAVHPDYQDLGVGSQLLYAIEQKAITNFQVNRIQLSVRTENTKAIHFYKRRGYNTSQESAHSIQMDKNL